MSSVRAQQVVAGYNGRPVLRSVDLDVAPGEWVAVIGPNGAGKSSLIKVLSGTLRPSEGDVWIGGLPLDGLTRRELSRLVAVVPQHPLLPEGTSVFDYALLGRNPYVSFWRGESSADLRTVRRTLAALDLDGYEERPVTALSGGEVQRAVLARALVQDAGLLLLDEPTAALDLGHQQQVLELVDRLRRSRDLAVVSALHDLTLAGQYADRLVMLDEGAVVAEGRPAEVLTPEVLTARYGANVAILEDEDGSLIVVPRRIGSATGGQESQLSIAEPTQ